MCAVEALREIATQLEYIMPCKTPKRLEFQCKSMQ
jgi:hypothetical protein